MEKNYGKFYKIIFPFLVLLIFGIYQHVFGIISDKTVFLIGNKKISALIYMFSDILLITIFYIIYSKLPENHRKDFGLKKISKKEIPLLILIAITVFVVGNIIAKPFCDLKFGKGKLLAGYAIGEEEFANNQFEGYPTFNIFLEALLLGPIVEECIFRYYMNYYNRSKAWIVYGFVISSILFGKSHGTLSQTIGAGLAGLSFCFFFYLTGNLLTSIILHVSANSFSLILSLISNDKPYHRAYFNSANKINATVYELPLYITLPIILIGLISAIKIYKSYKNRGGLSNFAYKPKS